MNCSKCNEKNLTYHNYCKNDGSVLERSTGGVVLKSNTDLHCIECGSMIRREASYCATCGKMNSSIGLKEEKTKVNTQIRKNEFTKEDLEQGNLFTGINKFNLNNVDIRAIFISLAMTISFIGVIAIILNVSASSMGSNFMADQVYMEGMKLSKFKAILLDMVVINSPCISMSLKTNLLSAGKISMYTRNILYSLIVILSTYISTRICFSKNTGREGTLENSIMLSVLYSVVIVFLGLISRFSRTFSEGVSFTLSVGYFGLFINGFILSLIGSYLGVSKNSKRGILGNLFKIACNTIFIGVGAITVIIIVLFLSETQYSSILQNIGNYIFEDNSIMMFLYFAIVGCILGGWIFVLSNLATINLLGVMSYNITSITKQFDFPFVLFTIIPIVLFILVGRKIKSKYGENQIKVVGSFSGIYALLMLVFSYFSTFTFKIIDGQGEYSIMELIYDIISDVCQGYSSIVEGYLNQVLDKFQAGISFGPNYVSVIVASFIFSFIFVYIGYRTKKERI